MGEAPTILSFEEARKLLRVSDKTLRAAVKRGDIRGRKIGSVWRFRSDDINAYFEGAPCSTVEATSGGTTSPSIANAIADRPSSPANQRRR